MKTTTMIKFAVQLCYDAYADYSRIVQDIAVVPPKPVVSFHPGVGWQVGGKMYKMTANELINHFGRCANYWTSKADTFANSEEVAEQEQGQPEK
jgi:hypothetical protein